MRKMKLFLVCALSLCSSFCISGCASSRVWNGPTVEPLVDGGGAVESGMYRGMPYVMASVNGSEPMKFLFDTGASMNLIVPRVAEKIGLNQVGKANVKGASGLIKKIPFAPADHAEFGPVAMSNALFLIQDTEHLSDFFDKSIAGLIGIRGLEEFTIDINYLTKQVAITHERLHLEDSATSVMYVRPGGLIMVPVMFTDPDEPQFSRTIWSLLDTGNIRVFDLHTNEAEHFVDQTQISSDHASIGVHGVKQLSDHGPFRAGLRVGTTQLEGMNASVSDIETRLDSNTLRNFRVKIDMKSRLVSFTRPDDATRLVSTERMGITNLWRFDGYRIDQTIEGSAAYLLGLRAFDEVMLIDGVEPSLLHVKTAYWAVEPEATTVTVRVRRVSDDGWVDVVLPIDGSVEEIVEQERINHKKDVAE